MKKSTGQASDTARSNSAANLERVSGVGTGEAPTPGKYGLLKEGPAHLMVAMTISPESAMRTLSLQYEIPDPNPPPLHHTVGKAQMDSVVTHDRVASGTTHLPNHEICTTLTCPSEMSNNMTHPLIMTVASRTLWKHKYTALPRPARQSAT